MSKFLQWFLVSATVVLMSACGGGGTMQTISGIVTDDPVSGATVKVKSIDGTELASDTTDANGSYSVEVKESDISDGFVVEATGGKVNGTDFNATLKAIYGAGDDLTKANATLITSLVAKLAADGNITGATLVEKRDAALQRLVDMGMVKATDWTSEAPSLVNMDQLRGEVQDRGVETWLDNMVVDLADSQLGSDKMSVFGMAHGGMTKLLVSPDNYIALFPGQEKRVAFFAEFADVDDKNITLEKVSGPSWVSIEDKEIVITPESTLETYDDFIITVEVLSNNIKIGRSKNIMVSVVKKVVLVSGELGSEGGKIENEWKDISISVDAGKLSQTYEIDYSAGITKDGHILFWTQITPDITFEEEISLKVSQPSYSIIKNNYLDSNAASSTSRNINRTVYDTNYASDGVPDECRPIERNVPDKDQPEMVWTDENNDSFLLKYVWQGTVAKYNTNHKNTIKSGAAAYLSGENSMTGGYPRLYVDPPSINGKTPEIKCSSALRSKIPDTDSIRGQVAVLFVHGFINTGRLGGYDHGGGGDDHQKPGGEYFDDFPRIIADYKGENNETTFIPFVFQWRTNARFQDVADELGRAVKLLAEKTGKKVHIVAHSFGGLLTRTLVQGQSYSTIYHGDFSEKYIATVTTVGTPHSGTFGDGYATTHTPNFPVEFDGKGIVEFPHGRHGETLDVIPSGISSAPAGAGIGDCQAITCYQTGSGEKYETDLLDGESHDVGDSILYGTKENAGYTVYSLYKDLNNYPEIPTQVLIGLVPESVSANLTLSDKKTISYDFMDDEATTNPGAGDYLISIFGQRIIPDSDITDLNSIYKRGAIEEHILPMDGRSSSFVRDIDDEILSEYSLDGNNRWNISNYRENVTVSDIKWFADGYNHRTGQYHSTFEFVLSYRAYRQSEVGLQNCISASNCNHSTWNYFESFINNHPAEEVDPPSKITVTGTVLLANGQAPDFPVTIEIHAGDSSSLYNTEFVDLKSDGTYESNITYSPDTNYTVFAYPENSNVRASSSIVLQTYLTLEESTLHFPTITLVDSNYEEGNMTIKITNGTTGAILNDFGTDIFNTAGNEVDDHEGTVDTGYSITLPKGDYTVKISKEGYNEGQAQCTVIGNETTECIVNIVEQTNIPEGTISVVLSWGANPSDLDSHLVRKTDGNEDYHVYYGHMSDGDASLDVDDTSSYGPETITITDYSDSSVYTYYVYNFSGGDDSVLPNSGAKVEVNFSDGQRTFYVPNEGGQYWKVFEIENGRIIPCTSGCVFGSEDGIVRSIDHDAQLFQNLPAK